MIEPETSVNLKNQRVTRPGQRSTDKEEH